ncbi:MAG: hypothetical protein IJB74_03925 [Clostridia bacterium]|nr:hypothetical protein [Clostridia bacterium]
MSGKKVTDVTSRFVSSGTSAPTFASRSVCFSEKLCGQLRKAMILCVYK